jgi:MFS family permease
MDTASSSGKLSAARKGRLVVAIIFAAIGFALLAPTRLDIAIILKEVMSGIGVTSLAAAGFISTATLLGDGLFEMIFGHISDRWSRTGTLVLGIIVFSTFSILTAVATNLTTLYIMRILLGVGQAMFIPSYFAFIGGIYGKRRGLLLGALVGMFTVGTAVNPLLTEGMYRATNEWQTPFIGFGVFGLVIAFCIFLVSRGKNPIYGTQLQELTPQPVSHTQSRFAWLANRNMLLLLVVMMLWGVTQYGFLGIFVTYLRTAQHFSLAEAAGVASFAGWSAFAFSFIAGYMSDHIGRRRTLLLMGVIALLLAGPLFMFQQTFWSAAILAAIFQAANGCFYPLGVAYAQDFARAEDLGAHSGAVSGVGHLVAGVSGFIVGSLAQNFGYAALGWFFIIASAVIVVVIMLTREPGRMPEAGFAPQMP